MCGGGRERKQDQGEDEAHVNSNARRARNLAITSQAWEHVVLVDESDAEVGEGEKLDVHRKGALHRAFSVFAFNEAGELLLQRRALGKYHSGGLWTNSACGHPRPGEAVADAARRRLFEELGIGCGELAPPASTATAPSSPTWSRTSSTTCS